jgi:hypothetical protein
VQSKDICNNNNNNQNVNTQVDNVISFQVGDNTSDIMCVDDNTKHNCLVFKQANGSNVKHSEKLNVTQQDYRHATAERKDRVTVVSSGGSPSHAQNLYLDIESNCDTCMNETHCNNAGCFDLRWGNPFNYGNPSYDTNTGHKVFAGGRGKARRDPR